MVVVRVSGSVFYAVTPLTAWLRPAPTGSTRMPFVAAVEAWIP